MDGMTGGRGEALRSHGARPASSPAGTPPLPSTPTRGLNYGVVTPSPASPASLRRTIPASETKEEPGRERRSAEWRYSGSGRASPVGQEIGIIARHTSGPTRRRLTDGSPLASASTDASRASAPMPSGPYGFLSARGSPPPRSSAPSRASHFPARSPAAPSPEHR